MDELETVELEVVTELDELNGDELRLEDADMKVSELLEPMLLDVGVEEIDISALLDTTLTLEGLDALEKGIDAVLEVLEAPAWGIELDEIVPPIIELELGLEDV